MIAVAIVNKATLLLPIVISLTIVVRLFDCTHLCKSNNVMVHFSLLDCNSASFL